MLNIGDKNANSVSSGAYVYLLSDTATYTTGIDIPIAGIVGAW